MRHKILTVDDSTIVRTIVRMVFRYFDCALFDATNGSEGLAIAEREMPDLILLDVRMPAMDGIEMLTQLKANARLKDIPVVMLTAEGVRDNVLKIARLGVHGYVMKPFNEDLLVEKVVSIIELKPVSAAFATVGPVHPRSNRARGVRRPERRRIHVTE
jgi:two-component system cell cycle response regulator